MLTRGRSCALVLSIATAAAVAVPVSAYASAGASAVVGCVLSAINEGAKIVTGHTGWPTWVQVGLNFLVPFLVSSYGYLTAQTASG